jgi:hypothetical protein
MRTLRTAPKLAIICVKSASAIDESTLPARV